MSAYGSEPVDRPRSIFVLAFNTTELETHREDTCLRTEHGKKKEFHQARGKVWAVFLSSASALIRKALINRSASCARQTFMIC